MCTIYIYVYTLSINTCLVLYIYLGFPGGAVVKTPPANARDPRLGFKPWVRKVPCSRKFQPTPVFLPVKFQGQRRLVCYKSMSWQRVRHD